MTCVPYQNLLTQKHDLDNQAEREGAKLAEDKAVAQVRTAYANNYAEVKITPSYLVRETQFT